MKTIRKFKIRRDDPTRQKGARRQSKDKKARKQAELTTE